MSSFFNSDMVRSEIVEINRLQEEIYTNMIHFDFLTPKEKMRNLDLLSELLEKQMIMWTRLSLESDPEAVKMKESIQASAILMGFAKDTDVGVLFSNMKNTITELKKKLDNDLSAS